MSLYLVTKPSQNWVIYVQTLVLSTSISSHPDTLDRRPDRDLGSNSIFTPIILSIENLHLDHIDNYVWITDRDKRSGWHRKNDWEDESTELLSSLGRRSRGYWRHGGEDRVWGPISRLISLPILSIMLNLLVSSRSVRLSILSRLWSRDDREDWVSKDHKKKDRCKKRWW